MVLAVAFVVYTTWGYASSLLIAAWALVLLGILFARRPYAQRLMRHPPADPEPALVHMMWFGLAHGLMIGAAAVLFFPRLPLEGQALLTMVLVCWTGGGVASAAAHPIVFHAFVIPGLLPLALLWAVRGGPDQIAIGVMIVLFALIQILFVRDNERVVRESFDIRYENERLLKELEARSEQLSRSVRQLTALAEVGKAISSTLELETVLNTIVERAVQLTGLDGGSIYEYDERGEEFRLQASQNMAPHIVDDIRAAPTRKGDGVLGCTAMTREPAQVPDTLDDDYRSSRKELIIRAGYRALLAVPLVREDHLLGALLVYRRTAGPFAAQTVDLLKTFAAQSALAIQNARLFREIGDKGRQLEAASRHKSDFLASMSHELRTPLNAILGFNEMLLGQVYGDVPASMREPLEDIQNSGKHLLRLINNVLDLAKIEAGRMELALSDYSAQDTVESVRTTLRPLAAEKGLELVARVPADIPPAYGDPGRITQCLLNLAGNSLKFTKAGRVEIAVAHEDGLLRYRVSDTGIGIPADKIETVFAEFRQTDLTIASEYGGTGLGLSITRNFIEMHGGRIWAESTPGKGSTFTFEIPLRVGHAAARASG